MQPKRQPASEMRPNSLNVTDLSFLVTANMIASKIAARQIRYQASNPSFSVINFPKIPVNPASTMAICSLMKAFFICRNVQIKV